MMWFVLNGGEGCSKTKQKKSLVCDMIKKYCQKTQMSIYMYAYTL